MISVGTLCLKIAGRDAGKRCIVLSDIKEGHVLVDGETRRREVSTRHLEPLKKSAASVKANASHTDVEKVCKELGWTAFSSKPKKAGAKPVRQKNQKVNSESKPKKAPAEQKEKVAKKIPASKTEKTEKSNK